MKNLATTLAWAFAAAFLAAAVMGTVPNPLVGPGGLFVTNTAHNLVHLATAVAFVVVALRGETASIRFMQAFGVVYLLTGAFGFVMLGSQAEGHCCTSCTSTGSTITCTSAWASRSPRPGRFHGAIRIGPW